MAAVPGGLSCAAVAVQARNLTHIQVAVASSRASRELDDGPAAGLAAVMPDNSRRELPCRRRCALGSVGVLLLTIVLAPEPGRSADPAPPIKLAVFDFELEDVSPAASFPGSSSGSSSGAGSAAAMDKVSAEARHELAHSGRYTLVDVSKVDAKPVTAKSLRNCDGCEAGIALQLGAEQSLIGVVIKATQTDYYVVVQIRDAGTGKIIDRQEANFAGSEEGWASGVRMLIRHQVLASRD